MPEITFRTLFRILFFSAAFWLLSVTNEVDPLSAASLLYAAYLILLLFDALGERFPFKELILALMGVQLLICPFLEYYYFHNEIFGVMRVAESSYFAYVFPCVIALHIGLIVFYPKRTYEKEIANILYQATLAKDAKIGWSLILIGTLLEVLNRLLAMPTSISFIVSIVIFSRFVGLFYLWFSRSSSFKLGFGIVFIPYIIHVIQSTIFIDLIIIGIFFASAYMMKHRITKYWLYLGAVLAFSSLMLLQSIKYGYRDIVWKEDFQGNKVELLFNMMANQINSISGTDLKAIASNMNIRLNQGWIVGDVIQNVSTRSDIASGSFFRKELLGILLPRFLFPDKPIVGDRQKFNVFTGWNLGGGTAMNVGMPGDGYGNFGYRGGIIFCFGFGFFLGYIFRLFYKAVKKHPTLLFWGILIFFYSMRAGNEFYIIGNWIIKSSIFVFIYFTFIENGTHLNNYLKKIAQKSLHLSESTSSC